MGHGPYFDAQIQGLEELLADLDNPTWVAEPARRFLSKWGQAVQRESVTNIGTGIGGWKDTGEVRRSITHEVDNDPFPLWARAGSPLDKARWGEYGTGLLSEDPESAKSRHWPPADALDAWAAKKKIEVQTPDGGSRILTGKDIARIIGMRGGLEPRRFMRDAVKTVDPRIEIWIDELAADIMAEGDAKGRKTG